MSLPPFDTVVRRHGPAVLRVCLALLGPNDADDAWSATFLSALRHYPSLPPGANVEAWLVTIAHRKAIDIHRARARHAVPTGELPETVSTLGQPGTGEPELWAAVGALPTKQRQCVAYRYLGGLTYAQIAQILGGSEAAARRAAADGVTTLRRTYHGSAYQGVLDD